MTDKPTTSSAAEFALQALVAAGHVSQELVDKAMALPGASQPAHSGEPVATVIKRGADRQWMSERLGSLPDGIYSLYLNPQPIQTQPVERELLCSTELESYSDAYADTPDEAVAFRDGWRLAEQHYGIKGGQHGADT